MKYQVVVRVVNMYWKSLRLEGTARYVWPPHVTMRPSEVFSTVALFLIRAWPVDGNDLYGSGRCLCGDCGNSGGGDGVGSCGAAYHGGDGEGKDDFFHNGWFMIVQSIDATAAPGIISSESAGRASGVVSRELCMAL